MLEKIFYRSQLWKIGMISRLKLPFSSKKVTFAEIISVAKLDSDELATLCTQVMMEYGVFTSREMKYLRQMKSYRAILEILSDKDIVAKDSVFWLKYAGCPEIVFEAVSGKIELYKVYVVDPKMAELCQEYDDFMIWVIPTDRVADVRFVDKLPQSVEDKRQQWLKQQ